MGETGADKRYEIILTLSIRSPPLSPDEITAALGISPTRTYRKGDRIKLGMPQRRAGDGWHWTYVRGAENPPVKLVSALETMVDGLEPHSAFLSDLARRGAVVVIGIGWFMYRGNVETRLPAALLGKIAAMGAMLDFDVYDHMDDDQDGGSAG